MEGRQASVAMVNQGAQPRAGQQRQLHHLVAHAGLNQGVVVLEQDKVEARVKPAPSSHSGVERIPVEKGGRKVLVPIDQIRYIEAKDDYSCIYTEGDRYLSTISLAKLEQKLAPHNFFRVHRGYIVNLDNVESVDTISSGILQLGLKGIDEKRIPVSRRRVVALKRALGL